MCVLNLERNLLLVLRRIFTSSHQLVPSRYVYRSRKKTSMCGYTSKREKKRKVRFFAQWWWTLEWSGGRERARQEKEKAKTITAAATTTTITLTAIRSLRIQTQISQISFTHFLSLNKSSHFCLFIGKIMNERKHLLSRIDLCCVREKETKELTLIFSSWENMGTMPARILR